MDPPKMTLRNVCGGLVFMVLLVSCVVLFVLHSLYFILRTASQTEKQEIKSVDEDQLFMPALVVCNRMPFTQDGLNAVNTNLRQDAALRYLMEWTNPSLREAADYNPPPVDFIQQGQNTVMQSMNPNTRNQSIQSMQYQCQSIVNSCSFQGIQMSSFDCCRSLLTYFPTTEGLCWMWRDGSMWQNSSGVAKQFTIIFQMTRNSWFSPLVQTHPGVDVYLQEGSTDVMRMATELENPIRMMDKRGVRLLMRKQRRADIRRPECGQALGDSRRSDENARNNNRTNYLMCQMMVAMRYCSCHPLMAELLHYDVSRFRDFANRVVATNVCSLEAYDNCARRYVDFARIENWAERIPRDLPGREDTENCRGDNHRSCMVTSYPGTIEGFDLPAEYQSTQDYVSRLTLEYSTMKTTEVLLSKDPNIYELLSFIGYNIALWFAVGHILWSLFAFGRNFCCPRTTGKVSPEVRKRITISEPAPILVEATHSSIVEEPKDD